jgi:hypothetical protein
MNFFVLTIHHKTKSALTKEQFIYSSLLKSIIILFCFLAPTFSQAQVFLGGGLTYGTEISKLGINLRGTYEIDDKIVAEPNVSFFFKENSTSFFAIDLNGRYKLFNIGETTEIYPVAGISIFRVNSEDDTFRKAGTNLGLNLGLGTQIESQTSDLSYFGEFKVTVGGIAQSTLTAGVLYGF